MKKKMKKLYSGINSIQTGLRQAEKERKKKYLSQIPFLPDPGKKIPKQFSKRFKKLKNFILALFPSKLE